MVPAQAHRGWDAGPRDPAPPQSFYPPDAQPYLNPGQPGFGPGQPGFGPGQPGFGLPPQVAQPGFYGTPPAAFAMGGPQELAGWGPPSAMHAPPPDLAGLSAGRPQNQPRV